MQYDGEMISIINQALVLVLFNTLDSSNCRFTHKRLITYNIHRVKLTGCQRCYLDKIEKGNFALV